MGKFSDDIPLVPKGKFANLKNVTRVHIITEGESPNIEMWADEWTASVQDEGRTLKLFAKGDGGQLQQARDQALGADIAQDQSDMSKLLEVLRKAGDVGNDGGAAMKEFIEYVMPSLPEPLMKQAEDLLRQINEGTF